MSRRGVDYLDDDLSDSDGEDEGRPIHADDCDSPIEGRESPKGDETIRDHLASSLPPVYEKKPRARTVSQAGFNGTDSDEDSVSPGKKPEAVAHKHPKQSDEPNSRLEAQAVTFGLGVSDYDDKTGLPRISTVAVDPHELTASVGFHKANVRVASDVSRCSDNDDAISQASQATFACPSSPSASAATFSLFTPQEIQKTASLPLRRDSIKQPLKLSQHLDECLLQFIQLLSQYSSTKNAMSNMMFAFAHLVGSDYFTSLYRYVGISELEYYVFEAKLIMMIYKYHLDIYDPKKYYWNVTEKKFKKIHPDIRSGVNASSYYFAAHFMLANLKSRVANAHKDASSYMHLNTTEENKLHVSRLKFLLSTRLRDISFAASGHYRAPSYECLFDQKTHTSKALYDLLKDILLKAQEVENNSANAYILLFYISKTLALALNGAGLIIQRPFEDVLLPIRNDRLARDFIQNPQYYRLQRGRLLSDHNSHPSIAGKSENERLIIQRMKEASPGIFTANMQKFYETCRSLKDIRDVRPLTARMTSLAERCLSFVPRPQQQPAKDQLSNLRKGYSHSKGFGS